MCASLTVEYKKYIPRLESSKYRGILDPIVHRAGHNVKACVILSVIALREQLVSELPESDELGNMPDPWEALYENRDERIAVLPLRSLERDFKDRDSQGRDVGVFKEMYNLVYPNTYKMEEEEVPLRFPQPPPTITSTTTPPMIDTSVTAAAKINRQKAEGGTTTTPPVIGLKDQTAALRAVLHESDHRVPPPLEPDGDESKEECNFSDVASSSGLGSSNNSNSSNVSDSNVSGSDSGSSDGSNNNSSSSSSGEDSGVDDDSDEDIALPRKQQVRAKIKPEDAKQITSSSTAVVSKQARRPDRTERPINVVVVPLPLVTPTTSSGDGPPGSGKHCEVWHILASSFKHEELGKLLEAAVSTGSSRARAFLEKYRSVRRYVESHPKRSDMGKKINELLRGSGAAQWYKKHVDLVESKSLQKKMRQVFVRAAAAAATTTAAASSPPPALVGGGASRDGRRVTLTATTSGSRMLQTEQDIGVAMVRVLRSVPSSMAKVGYLGAHMSWKRPGRDVVINHGELRQINKAVVFLNVRADNKETEAGETHPGAHWVALLMNFEANQVIFYDPNGMASGARPSMAKNHYLRSWIRGVFPRKKKCTMQVLLNMRQAQADIAACGTWCVAAAHLFFQGGLDADPRAMIMMPSDCSILQFLERVCKG